MGRFYDIMSVLKGFNIVNAALFTKVANIFFESSSWYLNCRGFAGARERLGLIVSLPSSSGNTFARQRDDKGLGSFRRMGVDT